MLHALLIGVGYADTENISLDPAKSAAHEIRRVHTQMVGDIAQQRVSLIHAEEGVDNAEMVYIQPDYRKALIGVLADELLRFSKAPIIHKFLRYTLSKVFYTGHLIPLRDKPSTFWRALRSGYLKYIGLKSIAVFWLKR